MGINGSFLYIYKRSDPKKNNLYHRSLLIWVYFFHIDVSWWADLNAMSNIYHFNYLCGRRVKYHIISFRCDTELEVCLWRWSVTNSQAENRKIGGCIKKKTSLNCTLYYISNITLRSRGPLRWKDINTYSNTHTLTQNYDNSHFICVSDIVENFIVITV